MARTTRDGLAVDSSLPWFLITDIVCPKCYEQFRLSYGDTTGLNVGPGGTNSLLWYGWRQVRESDTPLTAEIDSVNLHVDPAQIYGPCPVCGYNPIIVRGPRYNLTKIKFDTDPTFGGVQNVIAAGANRITFYMKQGEILVGVFLYPSGIAYQVDASGYYATAIQRIDEDSSTIVTHYMGSNIRVMTANDVWQLDSGFYDAILRAGFTII